jgi:hypothetical protein
LPSFERAVKDTNAWVRIAAVGGLARTATDRSTLEARLGPLLADPDKKVASRAALGLLEPEIRSAAGIEYFNQLFQYENISAFSSYNFNPSSDQRPLAVLETKPAFLEQARQRLTEAAAQDRAGFALLLAQYGDFSGLDRLLETGATDTDMDGQMETVALAGIALSHDAKYIPYLKKAAARAKEEYEFRRVLQALKGISGSEARELRLDINRHMRQSAG